jgi:hypothetical protein
LFAVAEGNNSVNFVNLRMSFTGSGGYRLISLANGNNGRSLVENCIFDLTGGGGNAGIYINDARSDVGLIVIGSSFLLSSAAYGIQDTGGNGSTIVLVGNYFAGGLVGLWDGGSGGNPNSQRWVVQNNVFNGNGRGIYAQEGVAYALLSGNSFYGQTNENVYLALTTSTAIIAQNNIFWGGTYGLWLSQVPSVSYSASNAYGNQGTAAFANWFASPSWARDVTLSANPFTNTATPNFALNSTAGGGAALKTAGFPGVTPAGTGYLDIGALQSQAAAGASIAAGGYVQ